jgi:predicted aspartyl protease
LPPHDVLEGSIDDLRRPFVRIELAGFSDPLVAFIDTGFNGALLIDEQQAGRLNFQIFRNSFARARLASQRDEDFLLGRGSLRWLGELHHVTAYVLIETPEARRHRVARKTEEEILLGTEMLAACRVEIDFPARRVLIAKTS